MPSSLHFPFYTRLLAKAKLAKAKFTCWQVDTSLFPQIFSTGHLGKSGDLPHGIPSHYEKVNPQRVLRGPAGFILERGLFRGDLGGFRRNCFYKLLFLSTLLTVELCYSWPAHADLIACNQSGETLYVSVMYHKSSNNAWTSVGHYGIDDNECDDVLNFDLNESVHYYAQASSTRKTHPSSNSTVTSFCIDRKDMYEVIWDGDDTNPWYKDLNYRSDQFRSCTTIHSDYEEVGFREIDASSSYDHCVISFGSNRSSSTICWN